MIMKQLILPFLLMLLPLMASADNIEGIYKIQPNSHRDYNGASDSYGQTYEITIYDNGNGTYYVDDLLGGWYCQRTGYGFKYAMTGNISINTDGIVSLKDSYVAGWNDGLISLTGTYDENNLVFTIEAEYLNGMKFFQTWVKSSKIIKKDGIYYKTCDNNTLSVIKKKEKYNGDIIIEDQLSQDGVTYSITSIDDYCFYDCTGITSVTLPHSIINIGSNSFVKCIGLKTMIIPNSVINIGNGAFGGCTELNSVELSNALTSLNSYVFDGCTGLTSVEIPNSVKSIAAQVFWNCTGLTSVTIPISVTSLDMTAFDNCSKLISLTIPKSVSQIHNSLAGCSSLASIIVEAGNSVYDSRNNCNAIIETSSNTLLVGCKNTIIPNNVTMFGVGAFSGCSGLTSMNIPNSVTAIENSTFKDCTGLTSIYIPQSVKNINGYAFYGCTGLKSVHIQDNVASIDNETFGNCSNIKDVYCYSYDVPQTDLYAFGNMYDDNYIQNVTLHVPASTINAYKDVEPWRNFKEIVPLPQCAKPTISFRDGNISFSCETEGVEYVSEITPPTMTKKYDQEINLSSTYTVTVYATKIGYNNSEKTSIEIQANSGIKGDLTDDGKVDVADHVKLSEIIMNQNRE